MLMSAVRCFRTVTPLPLPLLPLLLLLPLARASSCAPGAQHELADLSHPYDRILSPLLKALSEQEGSRWTPGDDERAKPDREHVRYLTEAYRRSRARRGADGRRVYSTVRLLKAQDECVARTHSDSAFQDLSYSLDQVRETELLLKSALLYNVELDGAPSSMCYLSVMEQEHPDQCQVCTAVHYAVNFTASQKGTSASNWVEVDVTLFLTPHFKTQKRNIQLHINITCPHEDRTMSDWSTRPGTFPISSPYLLLYLNDTSKMDHQGLQANVKGGQRPDPLSKQIPARGEARAEPKRRWRRESPKSKRGAKHLPEVLPSSLFPTSDCALYDFRVGFNQLKLDDWIAFPPKFNPRYCRGVCPMALKFFYGSPVHTFFQNIIYEKLNSPVPRPSCIPSHYSPLSVLILKKDGSYVYKEFEDMVAKGCTCR